MSERIRIEVPGTQARSIPLSGDRLTIGVDETGSVVLPAATGASRVHAALVKHPGGWAARDLGSVRGTLVNGERIRGERSLRPGDEIGVGTARIVFEAVPITPPTEAVDPAPRMTKREREVLAALCRPMLSGDLFTEPSSVVEVAALLGVSEAAVKQHLARLFDKFAIHDQPEGRRAALANAAIRRGAVGIEDLRGT